MKVNYKYVPIEKVKALKRTMKKSPVMEEYERILRELPQGQACQIDAKEEQEKPATIKNRILKISKSLNMTDLKVKKTGDVISFWRQSK
ncbi:hypothetical protein ACFLWZ_04585 [Chloroflexota bacterium]